MVNEENELCTFYQQQTNHSSQISATESAVIAYMKGYTGEDNIIYYKVPRHAKYGIGIDFELGKIDAYENGNIIVSCQGDTIDIEKYKDNLYFCIQDLGGNSPIDVTFYFGEEGFDYMPDGYMPLAFNVISNIYEKDNEIYYFKKGMMYK